MFIQLTVISGYLVCITVLVYPKDFISQLGEYYNFQNYYISQKNRQFTWATMIQTFLNNLICSEWNISEWRQRLKLTITTNSSDMTPIWTHVWPLWDNYEMKTLYNKCIASNSCKPLSNSILQVWNCFDVPSTTPSMSDLGQLFPVSLLWLS